MLMAYIGDTPVSLQDTTSFNFSVEHFQYSFTMLDLEVGMHNENRMEKIDLHGTFKDKRHIKRIVVKKKKKKAWKFWVQSEQVPM